VIRNLRRLFEDEAARPRARSSRRQHDQGIFDLNPGSRFSIWIEIRVIFNPIFCRRFLKSILDRDSIRGSKKVNPAGEQV
jgi:hypothetical protein